MTQFIFSPVLFFSHHITFCVSFHSFICFVICDIALRYDATVLKPNLMDALQTFLPLHGLFLIWLVFDVSGVVEIVNLFVTFFLSFSLSVLN